MPDATANLEVPYLVDSQAQKAATVNGMADLFDGALAGLFTDAMTDAAYTVAPADALSHLAIKLTGAITADRNVILPDNKKLYLVQNATTGSHALTFKTAAGTGISVAVAATYRALYCDGTNVVALVV